MPSAQSNSLAHLVHHIVAEITALFQKQDQRQSSYYLDIAFDDASPIKGRDLVAKTCFYFVILFLVFRWLCKNETPSRPPPRQAAAAAAAARHRLITGNELGQGEITEGTSQECAVCLETMLAGTIVRILPCRHVFHHDCIVGWFHADKFTCPLCKFDLRQHLEEQEMATVEMVSVSSSWRSGLLPLRAWWRRWRRIQMNDNHLLEQDENEGDLELTEESVEVNSADAQHVQLDSDISR